MTLRDRCAGFVATLIGRPPYQDRLRALIERHTPGNTFVDVGCMWNVDGAYAFHALDSGAREVTGVDMREATGKFELENARRGSRVRFIQGDVNDITLPDRVGTVDVVFCSGVLYHTSNPLFTLEQLRRMCGDVLILGSSTIAELDVPQGAVYYPFLDARSRRSLNYRSATEKVGLDTDFRPEWDYSNYFWGLTPSCVEAMLRTAGFEVLERFQWRHALCAVCRVQASGRPALSV